MVTVRATEWAPGLSGVQVVAHRGSSDDAPEHTLHAYKRALVEGADALECDVRLTKDGHLVCVHDRRIDRTSNGRGILSTLELAELNELDWGSWRDTWEDFEDPEMPDRDKSQILTLRRLLEAVAQVDRRVEVAIETKHPTRYGGLVEKRVAEMLHDFGWDAPLGGEPSQARVMSFSYTALQRMERLAPAVRLVQLIDKAREWTLLRRVMGRDWLVGPGIELLRENPQLAERIAASDHGIHVWTVNTEPDLRRCQELGAQAVITDRPAYMLELLAK
jgi:glycerophosphoryl diester phosphodiesterase